jgi:hypothetical protein
MEHLLNTTTKIFHIHIPKTGGSTLNRTLSEYDWFTNGGHCFYNNSFPHVGVRNTEGRTWRNYHQAGFEQGMSRIAVIRNPFTWLYSYYKHTGKTRKGLFSHKGWQGVRNYHNLDSCEDFLEYYLNDDNYWHTPPLQKSPLGQCKNQNELECDYLIYNENLDSFLEILFEKRLNKKYKPLKLNMNTEIAPPDLEKIYKKEHIDKLLDKFQSFFLLTGYKFNKPIDEDNIYIDNTTNTIKFI